jgi:hypothetical protein
LFFVSRTYCYFSSPRTIAGYHFLLQMTISVYVP